MVNRKAILVSPIICPEIQPCIVQERHSASLAVKEADYAFVDINGSPIDHQPGDAIPKL